MKLSMTAALLALSAFCLSAPSNAAGGLTCPQLFEAEGELTALLTELEGANGVQENSRFDRRLGAAANTAINFARAEGDSQLISLAQGMRTGWQERNKALYLANGDDMLSIYTRLYRRDC